MNTPPLCIGDRVIVTQSYFGFPAGINGTLVYWYESTTQFCRVRLDVDGQVHSIPCEWLAKDDTAIEEYMRGMSA